MKRIYIYYTVIVTSLLLLFPACSGMQDDIKGYLDEGETIYVGKIDSIKVHPGKNRIMVEVMMPYGMTQTNCIFAWKSPSGKAESKEFDIVRTSEEDIFQFYLEQLEEGQHDFKVITKDVKNNSSIIVDVGGYSYGEVYQSTLDNRNINSISISGENSLDAQIDWLPINNEQFNGCDIEYDKSDGTTGKIKTKKDETTTILPSYKAEGNMKWSSTYLPDSLAIDTFITDWEEIKLP